VTVGLPVNKSLAVDFGKLVSGSNYVQWAPKASEVRSNKIITSELHVLITHRENPPCSVEKVMLPRRIDNVSPGAINKYGKTCCIRATS
jgi:hypothetical protein